MNILSTNRTIDGILTPEMTTLDATNNCLSARNFGRRDCAWSRLRTSSSGHDKPASNMCIFPFRTSVILDVTSLHPRSAVLSHSSDTASVSS